MLGLTAFAQSDRGTITGTVNDPTGAVIGEAAIELRNENTGATYKTASTSTGNYVLPQLPTGKYVLTATAPGFKSFVRQNIELPVATTVRIDVPLEIGAATESVTVSDTSPLLKTESGELSINVPTERMNNLPVMGIGARAGSAGIRNPYSVVMLLPGSDFRPDSSVRINGNPSNTQSLRIEGQDATNNLINTQSQTQPSVDAIQEFAIQTSNFAAEYGQVAGGFFNATMKSGTNQFHGSVYNYFVNEALNAGQPFTNDGNGHLIRQRQRRNDYGGTIGGPIRIPKIYDGRDKSFFFFNFEQFRETIINNNTPITVPTLPYRTGDFSGALRAANNRIVGTDPLGNPIPENGIYDPTTTREVNGQRVRDRFNGNVIPLTQLDPVALNIQSMIPEPNRTGFEFVNNYLTQYTNPRLTYIPSVKLDHNLSPSMKISGYWSLTHTDTPNNNALPFPLNPVPTNINAHTIRVSLDYTITPTMLLHLGAGLVHNYLNNMPNRYDVVSGIGLRGTYTDMFPSLQSLSLGNGGGMANMGPGSATQLLNTKPTANASLSWVRGNHTIKFGGEMVLEQFPTYNETYANAWIVFAQQQSGIPSTNGQNLVAQPGFNYASFLLGGTNNGFIGIPSKSRLGNHAFSAFAQDTWKVTRKLTLDYGLRYDTQSYLKEQYGRIAYFSPSALNPTAGNRPGGIALEGNQPGHCGCNVAKNYPWAFGPRFGLAYQISPKTVLRMGVGISYYRTAMNGYNSLSTGSQNIYQTAAFGDPAYNLRDGLPYQVSWPNTDPGQVPFPGTIAAPGQQIDQNAGRPARTVQWSLGIQREVARNLVVEATYVGNRGVWWNSTYLICPNCNTPEGLLKAGLDINNPAHRGILTSAINSSTAINAGYGGLPYEGFPATASVAQALRPFPQFGSITNMKWVPTGKNWYDSLQVQATKRYSHGLDLTSSFTWSRTFTMGTEADISTISPVAPAVNDVFNRSTNKYLSGLDQPFLFVLAANYTTPGVSGNKWVSYALKDWTVGAVMRYGSGFPIMVPATTNSLNALLFRATGAVASTAAAGGTFMNRVPGQPFFTEDLNCHCFDPQKDFVLNKDAWVNPGPADFSTSAAYYTDYRQQRRPSESMSLARNFRFGTEGRYNLQIRGEFSNIFNRTQVNNPTSTNALAQQTISPTTGLATAGFGWINTATVNQPARAGTLVGRFTF